MKIFCPPASELLNHTAGSGVETVLCPLRQDYDLLAASRLAGVIRSFRPDVVHAHHPRAHAIALLASYVSPVRRLVVSRRVSFRLKKWNLFSQWKYKNPRIHSYVAVSDDIKQVLVHGGVNPARVRVIHSGVDTTRFSPRPPADTLRRQLGLPQDKPIVGNLTHYSWWKGQPQFLEAAKRVIDSGTKAHFLLVGKGTDEADAQEQVRRLNLGDHVTLAGFRTDMPEVISLLSVSVLSSLAGEGFSGVLRECMSMGIPVAATDVGGNRELVQNGKTGLLVPAGDVAALAAAIQKLLADRSLASACASAAQKNVRENYSIERMVDNNIRLYEEITAGL